jgi:Zn-dependent protease with chaperone function
MKNITLDKREKIFKDFRNINAKGYSCQMLITTKRLVIYSNGVVNSRGKRAKQKRMNEIDLNSIHRLEYYIETTRPHFFIRILGLLIFVGAAYAGYLLYMGRIAVPASIPWQPYIKYVASGFLAFLGLLIMLTKNKILYLKIISGADQKTIEKLDVNRYNELAVRYIASKVRTIN